MAEKIVVQRASGQGGDVDPHAAKLYVPNDSGEGWTTHYVETAGSDVVAETAGAELDSASEARTEVHEQVLEHMAKGAEQQTEDIDALKAEVAELKGANAAMEAQLAEMRREIDTLRASAAVDSESRQLADKQPRRVRNLDPSNPDSPTERLVKYTDGSFEWVPTTKDAEVAEVTDTSVGSATVESEDAVASSDAEAGESAAADTLDQEGVSAEATTEKKAEPQEATAPNQEAGVKPEVTGDDTSEKPAEEKSEQPVEAEPGQDETTEPEAAELADESEPPKPGQELVVRVPSKELEVHRGVEIPPELATLLQEATDRYAEETAKSRNGYLGQFLRTSKVLVNIPVVGEWLKRAADRVNDFADRDLNEARTNYERTLLEAQKVVSREVRAQNVQRAEADQLTPEQLERAVQYNIGLFASQTDRMFEERVVVERMDRSKPTNRIINWWANHNGIGGKLAKFAGVATVGATVGGLATTLGVIGGVAFPGVGAVAGMAAGAAIGNYVTKRRANAVDGEGVTLAERQSREDSEKKQQVFNDAMDQAPGIKNPNFDPNDPSKGPEYVGNRAAFVIPKDLTAVTENRTAEEMRANRRRVAAAKAAGGLGGGIGEVLTNGILDNIGNNGNVAQARTGELTPDSGVNNGPTPPDASGVENLPLDGQGTSPEQFQGLSFDVESGSGYTNELMQFAQANGHELTPQQAWDLHQNLVGRFGGDYLDIVNRAQDVYQTGGDFRLTAPGQATWDPGVAEAVKEWMTGQGLW